LIRCYETRVWRYSDDGDLDMCTWLVIGQVDALAGIMVMDLIYDTQARSIIFMEQGLYGMHRDWPRNIQIQYRSLLRFN